MFNVWQGSCFQGFLRCVFVKHAGIEVISTSESE